MPRYEVTVNALDDMGGLIWGFSRSEGVRAGEDAEANALRLAGKLLDSIDEAKASIKEQSGVDIGLVAQEQEEADRA